MMLKTYYITDQILKNYNLLIQIEKEKKREKKRRIILQKSKTNYNRIQA